MSDHYAEEYERERRQSEQTLRDSIYIQINTLPLEDLKIINAITINSRNIKPLLKMLKNLLKDA